MKTYNIARLDGKVIAKVVITDDETLKTIQEYPLNPRTDLMNHSAEFDYGYPGSGSTQLALAMLADHCGKEREHIALSQYQAFKESIVKSVTATEWGINSEGIDFVLNTLIPRIK